VGSKDVSTGSQVSALQKFLAQDRSIYPEGEVTGYFGPQTQKAVQRFQARYGIVTSGTPDTTGYGSVGARTRTVIQSLCEKADEDDEDEEEEEENDIDSIDEIIVYLNKDAQRAEVQVIINKAPDLAFVHTYVSQAKAVTFIGEKLENSYGFDFDEFSTDRKRDIQLKRLIEWEYEEEDEDEDTLTLEDIRRIIVSSSDDGYADVTVDLRDSDDLVFDVAHDTERMIVRSIAHKLENSYDFDFDEYSSDRKRDSDLKKLIDWEEDEDEVADAYGLGDIKTVTAKSVDPIPGAIDDEYTLYTITLNNGTKHEVKVNGMVPAEFIEKSFRATGYTGSIKELTALAVSEIDAVQFGFLVKALTNNTAKASFSLSTPCVPFTLSWGDNVAESRQASKSPSQICAMVIDNVEVTHTYKKAGTYAVKLTVGNKSVTQNVTVSKASTASYGLSDVKTVTSTYVDPIPNAADDEHTVYTITLKNGTKHEVKVGFTTVEYRNKMFADTGYTGDVPALMALAKADPSAVSSFGIDDIKSVTAKSVDPIPNAADDEYTLFTITLKSGAVREVKRNGFAPAETFLKALKAIGYTGDAAKLVALAKTTSDAGSQKTTPFSISDVKSVVTKFVDPTPSNSYTIKSGDEYTQYLLTLKDGSKRSVDVTFGSYAGVADQFKKIGFTGSVWDITIMGVKGYGAVQGASTTKMNELLESLVDALEELKKTIIK
jgi:PKD repeat protein